MTHPKPYTAGRRSWVQDARMVISLLRWSAVAICVTVLLVAVPEVHAAGVQPWTRGELPALSFEAPDGRRADSAGLKGKTVVVNFWAAWCEPCRKELPAIERLASSLKGQPVEVLLVNTGDTQAVIDKVLARAGVSMASLRLSSKDVAANTWQLDALPATLIVGSDSRPRWIVRGALDVDAQPVRGLLAQMSTAK